jgi:hypothetical protein
MSDDAAEARVIIFPTTPAEPPADPNPDDPAAA